MCGIAGILSTTQDLHSTSARDTLSAMQTALSHRGPDGQGEFISPSRTAALCHTRLSIIDLSDAGHQPMVCHGQRYAITFNGEIYNYQTLRADLELQGEEFSSNSDTEVLLKLYQREGHNCVNKLRGMFAFVIWDEHEQRAFAARDPLGIKPLYYCLDNHGTLAFASEIRSLMVAGLHSSELNSNGIRSYFLTGTIAEPNTVLNDIKLLPAGTSLNWAKGQIDTEKYWELPFFKHQTKASACAEPRPLAVAKTRAALESTVKAHFVSDVPVGIFLSGGIDSTALVALAKKVTDSKINTYSIAFESPEWNEGDIAKRVSEHFDTTHTEFLVTPKIAKPLFQDFLTAVDQPTIDGFNTYCVCRLAKDAGEKVVLSGVGADELFAGYKSFAVLPKMQNLSYQLSWLSSLFNFINHNLAQKMPTKLQRGLDFLSQPNSLATAHQCLRGIFSTQESMALCASMRLEPTAVETNKLAYNEHASTADHISAQELTTYMRNQLLRDSDVMSMACGLELRVPFVDRQLVESIADIPADIRLEFGKKLLIDAVPELPNWVVNRPKQGFRFPFDEWFSSEWSELPVDKTVPAWVKLTPWYRRWALLILSDWRQRHLEHAHNANR